MTVIKLGHAILHQERAGLSREPVDLKAESVAYVCAELDIDSPEYSFG